MLQLVGRNQWSRSLRCKVCAFGFSWRPAIERSTSLPCSSPMSWEMMLRRKLRSRRRSCCLVVLCSVARPTGWHPSWAYCKGSVPMAGRLGVCASAALMRRFRPAANKCMQRPRSVFLAPAMTSLARLIGRGIWYERRLASWPMVARLSSLISLPGAWILATCSPSLFPSMSCLRSFTLIPLPLVLRPR